MKLFVFPYYISLGKNYSVDGKIECELSEQMAKRLERSAKEGGRYNLLDDEDIRDIYEKVYEAIIKVEKEAKRRGLLIGIVYPEEFQHLEATVTKKVLQTKCEEVVLEKEKVDEFMAVKENQDKLIYVDEGTTLFYVPNDFSGKLVIPSKVKKIELGAVSFRGKITEIVIEDGLESIDERAFDECKRLKKITIPGTVKRIGEDAFCKCEKLQEVKLSEGIEEIYPTAFRMCSSLKELHLPKTIKSVSTWMLSYFNGLKDLYIQGKDTKIVDFDRYQWRVMLYVIKESEAGRFVTDNGLNFKYIES